jgi:hypothetical protein
MKPKSKPFAIKVVFSGSFLFILLLLSQNTFAANTIEGTIYDPTSMSSCSMNFTGRSSARERTAAADTRSAVWLTEILRLRSSPFVTITKIRK